MNNMYDTEKLCGKWDKQRGYNQTTACGKPFWVMDPRPEDIRILDIAAQLSRICRFGGAIRDDFEIYSVAQHSVLVSNHVPKGFELEGLLHDAAEAYVGDMIKPIKSLFPSRESLEHSIDLVIRSKFNLPMNMSPQVKEADYYAVATEKRDVCPRNIRTDWGALPAPWPDKIIPVKPSKARKMFIERYVELTEK